MHRLFDIVGTKKKNYAEKKTQHFLVMKISSHLSLLREDDTFEMGQKKVEKENSPGAGQCGKVFQRKM